ncbi:hypothetical protein DSO57_1008833 [Entomophthora muscae]|uniref:Uncharacterized protein n=1 Tax=Entomophthora muscae TaxID=34485 RepID=A0ACC2RLM9_9FUNG|nr:hypothetical protein DSO57_1008833 [Entomophthora muscae]
MKEIPSTPPYPMCLLLKSSVVPHNGSWRPLATAVNYIVRIAPIVYMAFQERPASPVGVQPYFGMGLDINTIILLILVKHTRGVGHRSIYVFIIKLG